MSEPDLVAYLATLDAEDDARRARLAAPDALHGAARWYADVAGWPVFPCQPALPGRLEGGKKPLTIHGFHEATTDPDQIDRWWQRTPDARIGTPTGHTFDVIDIDGPPGFASLAAMRDHGILPPLLAKTLTPHGRHLFIEPTGDRNTARMMPGVDYRGAGGYIILPPSPGDNGLNYEWADPPDLTRIGAGRG